MDFVSNQVGLGPSDFKCRILLENVTEDDTAVQMLAQWGHPLWSDSDIESQLSERLAESKDACVSAIELIAERLEDVLQESRDLESIVGAQDHLKTSLGDKEWRRRVAKKLRFSFSKSRLDENLTALRSLNDDFRTLSSQTASSLPAADVSRGPARHITKEVHICRTIGKASGQVYKALGKACTKHSEHLAHFNLKVEHEPCRGTTVPELKFNMAFTHLTLAGLCQVEPVWFVVDSIIEDAETTNPPKDVPKLDQLTGSLKRQTSASQDCAKTRSKKRVHFQSSAHITPNCNPSSPSSSVMAVPSIRRDFCDYLRKCINQTPCKPGDLKALLETADGCKHIVYLSPTTVARTSTKAVSLQQYISSVSGRKEPYAFPRYERVRLAKALATAVLQYHGTPWLQGSWRSPDVMFFDRCKDIKSDESPNLSTPHLNVKVRGPDGQNPHTICDSPSLAPNPLLFGLGVMLLEIAHSATLKSLQEPRDLVNDTQNEFNEFFTAKRLSNSVGRELGSSYGKIVKKLLHCDFGCGDDLNEPGLQAGYYRDVVCELDRLEQGFRNLQLGY
ncbi:MAG: hypothetical protein Q9195_009577 [Heterodermia aff. obscurata]